MSNSKTPSPSYANDATKASSKKPSVTFSERQKKFSTIDGRELSLQELRLMPTHKVNEVLLYNILLEVEK